MTWPTRAAPLSAPTASPTVPLPVPLPPAATEIHATPLDTVQAHPPDVVTATETFPPGAAIESPDRLSENRHGAPAWLSCRLCDPTLNVPDRAEGTGFAATV